MWLQEHDAAFSCVKELLTLTSMVKPFNHTKETLMLTDASRLYGLGFALIQKFPTKQCLTDYFSLPLYTPSISVSYTHLTLPTTPYV